MNRNVRDTDERLSRGQVPTSVRDRAVLRNGHPPERPAVLPEVGFMRIRQILAVYPIGRSTWWAGVKSGRFPRPVKLGPRTTAWRVEDIRRLLV
jgi:predicted DNA-binding transcriptional regulator AlpA